MNVRRATVLLLAACALLVASRIWILGFATIHRSTVGVFAEMAFEYRLAAERGESFYDLHARRARQAGEEASRRGGPPADAARENVEYPPLAVAWIVLPAYFAQIGDFDAYARAFRALHALVDAVTFVLVWWLARRMKLDPGWPLFMYALGGLALFHLLYERIDLAMAALMAAALALLISRAHWSIAFALLALAVNFKLVPIVLAPAFVIGATPAALARHLPALIRALLARSAVLAGLCVIFFLPFHLAAGREARGFLDYHAERGVQVESIPANLLLLAGQVSGLAYTHGATNVVSPLAPAVSIASTVGAAALLAAISLWMIRWSRRDDDDPAHRTIAQSNPRQVLGFAVVLLAAAMATAKVFSPQYLLWLVPLAPLAAPGRWRGAGFLLVCIATTAIFPYAYFSEIVRAQGYTLLPPSKVGVLLLSARNGLFIAWTIALCVTLRRNAATAQRAAA